MAKLADMPAGPIKEFVEELFGPNVLINELEHKPGALLVTPLGDTRPTAEWTFVIEKVKSGPGFDELHFCVFKLKPEEVA